MWTTEIKPCPQSPHQIICYSAVVKVTSFGCDWSDTVSLFPRRLEDLRARFSQSLAVLMDICGYPAIESYHLFMPFSLNFSTQQRHQTTCPSHGCLPVCLLSLKVERLVLPGHSQWRTPNSLKVNETYISDAAEIHLNPQTNLRFQWRQTSLCAPNAALGITNHAIFCPCICSLMQTCGWR